MIEIAPQAIERMNFDTAWLYCATLTYDNKYDWRLPTMYEVMYSGDFNFNYYNLCTSDTIATKQQRDVNLRFQTIPVRTVWSIKSNITVAYQKESNLSIAYIVV